jgi:glycosyltransferase involved in cell wall biosynthesis
VSESKPLRVALNAVAARPGGGLSYLLNQIPQLKTCVDLRVFVGETLRQPMRNAFPDLEIQSLPGWANSLPLRLLWEHLVFPSVARDADVLYSIGSFASLTRRKPQVVVVLIPYVFGPEGQQVIKSTRPHWSFKVRVAAQRLLGRVTLRRATMLIATSEFTASQIRASAGDAVEVRVVPIAGAEIPPNEAVDEVATPAFERPFALSVGSDPPHKDQLGFIRSWPVDCPLDLVLVGNGTVFPSSAIDAAVKGREDIHWVGPVAGYKNLFGLYRDASLVVAHSLLEGFGMTPLEAMAQSTPVVASDIPAHREVCGNAALYYDPLDGASLAAAIDRVLTEPGLADSMVAAGKERLEPFSWDENGKAMCAILREAGHGR